MASISVEVHRHAGLERRLQRRELHPVEGRHAAVGTRPFGKEDVAGRGRRNPGLDRLLCALSSAVRGCRNSEGDDNCRYLEVFDHGSELPSDGAGGSLPRVSPGGNRAPIGRAAEAGGQRQAGGLVRRESAGQTTRIRWAGGPRARDAGESSPTTVGACETGGAGSPGRSSRPGRGEPTVRGFLHERAPGKTPRGCRRSDQRTGSHR